MIKTLIPLALLATLAACDTQPTVVEGGIKNDLTPEQMEAAKTIELPPSILASKSYRCKDNSILYIDWLDNGGAKVHKVKGDAGIKLAPDNDVLTGDKDAATITYEGLSCKG